MIIQKEKLNNESRLQADFYHLCRTKGISCALEYSYTFIGGERAKFDAIVFGDDQEALLLVECKYNYRQSEENIGEPSYTTKQIEKYKRLQIPLLIINRFCDVDYITDKIKEIIDTNGTLSDWENLKYVRRRKVLTRDKRKIGFRVQLADAVDRLRACTTQQKCIYVITKTIPELIGIGECFPCDSIQMALKKGCLATYFRRENGRRGL